jgi:GT2 family glycosyltransferase
MKDVLVSVVIPVAHDSNSVVSCVEKVLKQDYEKKEVVIACDETAEPPAHHAEEADNVRVVTSRGHGSFAGLVNNAMKSARGTIKILLTPECKPAGSKWLTHMIEPFDDESVGVVVSQCKIEEKKRLGLYERLIHAVDDAEIINTDDDVAPRELVSHRCDAYRAGMLAELGYFEDKSFASPGEAVDMSVKIAESGYSVVCSPDATVYYRPLKSQSHFSGVFSRGLDYGYSDAALSRLHGLDWFNSRLFATALFSFIALPLGAANLPVGVILALALFAWGWFISVRVPLVPIDWPVGLWSLAVYVAIILVIRDEWAPWLFGEALHPAIIRQWCLLAAVGASYLLIVLGSAATTTLRSIIRYNTGLRSIPIFGLAFLWWLTTGVGFLKGAVLGRTSGN